MMWEGIDTEVDAVVATLLDLLEKKFPFKAHRRPIVWADCDKWTGTHSGPKGYYYMHSQCEGRAQLKAARRPCPCDGCGGGVGRRRRTFWLTKATLFIIALQMKRMIMWMMPVDPSALVMLWIPKHVVVGQEQEQVVLEQG